MATKKINTFKELRESVGLSQSAFAKAIGVSSSSVSAYENGKTVPGEDVLNKIKELYGVVLKAVAPKAEEKPAKKAEKKEAAKAEEPVKTAANEVVIQSPMGGDITPAEILAKTGDVDKVYVRVDENKAYWVRGEESGFVDLW